MRDQHFRFVVVVTATVIDCQATEADRHRGFFFRSHEGLDSILTGVTIANGYAPRENIPQFTGWSLGGAIRVWQSSPRIDRCVMTDCVAADYGGAIFCEDDTTPIITRCTIQGNQGGTGGGAYFYHCQPLVSDTVIADNTLTPTGSAGGGIMTDTCQATITHCTIVNNTSTSGGGGGVHLGSGGSTITSSLIAGNSADYGGGIMCSGTTTIASCLIIGNTAFNSAGNGWGGGVYVYFGSDSLIVNSTIVDNAAGQSGGGVHISSETGATLANTILWHNEAPYGAQAAVGVPPHGIYDASLAIRYCDVEAGQTGVYVASGGTLTWGAGNKTTDPLFVDALAGDYHLLAGSPCIDAGNNSDVSSGVATDIDDDERIIAAAVDIGCDEVPTVPTLWIGPAQLTALTRRGSNPPAGSFTVQNRGPGTIDFEITEDADWLLVEPASGGVSGDAIAIGVSYDVRTLPLGTYDATITVNAAGVWNSPKTIAVRVRVGPVHSDFNVDGDVDLGDFAQYQACFNGPNRPAAEGCVFDADFDFDGDVDVSDFGLFLACFNGSNRPPACGE